MQTDILTRDKSGFPVSCQEPDFIRIHEIQLSSRRILAEMNTSYHDEEETRGLLEKLTGKKIDGSTTLLLPFYTDFGRNIVLGRDVFINTGCTFMDRGGIVIDDGALIGPNVNLTTLNHSRDPQKRHITRCQPIHICKNAWVGIGAAILPGVTIGEGSIVAAGSVVTKDVPAMTIVAGVPAAVIGPVKPEPEEERGIIR